MLLLITIKAARICVGGCINKRELCWILENGLVGHVIAGNNTIQAAAYAVQRQREYMKYRCIASRIVFLTWTLSVFIHSFSVSSSIKTGVYSSGH